MGGMRWIFLAGAAAPLAGVVLAFTVFDRPSVDDYIEMPVARAGAPVAAVAADLPPAPQDGVRVVGPHRVADVQPAAGSVAKTNTDRLPPSAIADPVTSRVEMTDGKAVVVRESGEEGVVLIRVDPVHRTTEIGRGTGVPAVAVERDAGGAVVAAEVTMGRDKARSVLIEALESPAEVANAVFFRSDLSEAIPAVTAH